MYGFAGTNALFKLFLQNYTTRETSEYVLDSIILLAQTHRIQFFLIRYDGEELKLFAYSPDSVANPEIFRISNDPAIDRNMYAIGSGKSAKEYKKNRMHQSAQLPIRKIIAANLQGLKKSGMLNLNTEAATRSLTTEESKQAFIACNSKGGDLFTGGEVKMSQNATQEKIANQIAILEQMDQQAKVAGAVCASPVKADLEVKELNSIGQYAVSPHKIELTDERRALILNMSVTLAASI
jgi:hypothetical protein